MDPNTALAEIRDRLIEWHETGEGVDGNPLPALEHIAELVEGLDQWLSTGGFKPTAWDYRIAEKS